MNDLVAPFDYALRAGSEVVPDTKPLTLRAANQNSRQKY